MAKDLHITKILNWIWHWCSGSWRNRNTRLILKLGWLHEIKVNCSHNYHWEGHGLICLKIVCTQLLKMKPLFWLPFLPVKHAVSHWANCWQFCNINVRTFSLSSWIMGIEQVVFSSCATMGDRMYVLHPRFSGKRIMSVPFHIHHIIADLLPEIFFWLSQLTQALKSHMYENNEAVKSSNSATVHYSRKCLLWPFQYHSEVPSSYQCSWTIFKLRCTTRMTITIL